MINTLALADRAGLNVATLVGTVALFVVGYLIKNRHVPEVKWENVRKEVRSFFPWTRQMLVDTAGSAVVLFAVVLTINYFRAPSLLLDEANDRQRATQRTAEVLGRHTKAAVNDLKEMKLERDYQKQRADALDEPRQNSTRTAEQAAFRLARNTQQLIQTEDVRRTLSNLIEQGNAIQVDCRGGGPRYATVPDRIQLWRTDVSEYLDSQQHLQRFTLAFKNVGPVSNPTIWQGGRAYLVSHAQVCAELDIQIQKIAQIVEGLN